MIDGCMNRKKRREQGRRKGENEKSQLNSLAAQVIVYTNKSKVAHLVSVFARFSDFEPKNTSISAISEFYSTQFLFLQRCGFPGYWIQASPFKKIPLCVWRCLCHASLSISLSCLSSEHLSPNCRGSLMTEKERTFPWWVWLVLNLQAPSWLFPCVLCCWFLPMWDMNAPCQQWVFT